MKGNPDFKKGHNIGKDTQFKPGNKAAKGHKSYKLPKLDEYLAKVLGDELHTPNCENALEIILKALRFKAVKGDTKAAALLLDRAYGKSKQFIEQINKNQVDLKDLTSEELLLLMKIQNKQKGDSAESDS